MSENTVAVKFELIDKMSKDLEKIRKELDKTSESTNKATKEGGAFGSLLSKINPLSIATGLGFVGLGASLKSIVCQFADSEKVGKQLNAVLKSTNSSAGMTRGALDELAKSLSDMAAVDDEAIQKGETLLLTFRDVGKNIFPQAMNAALDLSAVLGQDLQSSIMQIGKALNEPVEGMMALRRAGVQLTKDQEDMVRIFTDAGEKAKAQEIILGELAIQMGGQASEAAKGLTGEFDKLKVEIGNVAEKAGGVLAPTIAGLMSGIRKMLRGEKGQLDVEVNVAGDYEGDAQTAAIAENRKIRNAQLAKEAAALKEAELRKKNAKQNAINAKDESNQRFRETVAEGNRILKAREDAKEQKKKIAEDERAFQKNQHAEWVKQQLEAIALDEERTAQAKMNSVYRVQATGNVVGALGSLNRAMKGNAKLTQSLLIGETIMNTSAAIMKIMAQGGMFATPMAIATGIQGAAQVATIASQKFARGALEGPVKGPKTGDRVPIMANGGEGVFTEEQQARLFRMATGKERGSGFTINVTAGNGVDTKTIVKTLDNLARDGYFNDSYFLKRAMTRN